MTFYVAPPKGKCQLEKLYTISEIRIRFLRFISKIENKSLSDSDISLFLGRDLIQESDCLVDSTLHDRLSHFILRLCCQNSYSFQAFFIENEVKLFHLRLEKHTHKERCFSLRSLKRQIISVSLQESSLDENLSKFLSHVKNLANILIAYYVSDTPTPFKYSVPFQYVCKLVANHNVVLERGKAIFNIPDDVNDLLENIFEYLISSSIRAQRNSCFASNLEHGDRLSHFSKLILTKYYQGETPTLALESNTKLTLTNFEEKLIFFPPCMQNLNVLLNKHNRLTHTERIQYTLFLKDCGLSLESSIRFWGEKYSKPLANDCSTKNFTNCSHKWDKDGKRYIYGLRHLYGLEGAKISYNSHSCTSIQNSSVGGVQGGCIFTNFNHVQMKLNLSQQNLDNVDIEDIISASDKPGQACKKLLLVKARAKGSTDAINTNFTDKTKATTTTVINPLDQPIKKPLDYFLTLGNLIQGFT